MSVWEPTARIRETAWLWLTARPVYLDTETTGLDAKAEICEIAIVDHDGRRLLDTLVKPRRPIPQAATDLHGITDQDVSAAPTFPGIFENMALLLTVRPVVVYNADYDLRLIRQSALAWGLTVPELRAGCAMLLYAEYHGEWNDYRGNYRWQRLGNAARQCGLAIPPDLHRAAADAELTRRLLQYIAGERSHDLGR
jgi:DNA polymerase-3 subunit epsilon